MSDVQWGESIPCNGVCPDWLRDGDIADVTLPNAGWIRLGWCGIYDLNAWNWPIIKALRLPADHPYYTVHQYNAEHGTAFFYWPGGDSAPADWDGKHALRSDGVKICAPFVASSWARGDGVNDIIGYTRRHVVGDPAAATDGAPPAWAIERAGQETGRSMDTPMRLAHTGDYVTAFARYIAAHETAPVDPAVKATREILAAWDGCQGIDENDPHFQAALAIVRGIMGGME